MTDLAGRADANADASGMPWRIQVMAALTGFPNGASLAQLTCRLAGSNRTWESLYRRTNRALHASERRGHVLRASQDRLLMPFGPGQANATGYGQPAIFWQLTPVGASYLTTWGQPSGAPGDASATGVT